MYVLAALLSLVNLINYCATNGRYGMVSAAHVISTLLLIGGYVVLAVALLMKKRDILLPLGFLLLAVTDLFGLSAAGFFRMLAYFAMAFLGVVFLTDYLSQFREQLKKLWFLPGALCALATVVSLFYYGGYGIPFVVLIRLIIRTLLGNIPDVAAAFLAAIWMVYPDGFGRQTNNYNPNSAAYNGAGYNGAAYNSAPSNGAAGGNGYISLVNHILLLIFTFGIWQYIWIYRVTGYTNNVRGEERRDPTNQLLLCLFVPFYTIYWVYKTAQRIDKMAAQRGIPSDLSTLCLILEFFVAIVPPILIQDKLNAIVTAPGYTPNPGYQTPPTYSGAPTNAQPNPYGGNPGYQERPTYSAAPTNPQPNPYGGNPGYQERPTYSAAPTNAQPNPYGGNPVYQERPTYSAAPTNPQPNPYGGNPGYSEAPASPAPGYTVPAATPRQLDPKAVEQLKEYKQLLDMGIITQEEFNEKRRQLLGL